MHVCISPQSSIHISTGISIIQMSLSVCVIVVSIFIHALVYADLCVSLHGILFLNFFIYCYYSIPLCVGSID